MNTHTTIETTVFSASSRIKKWRNCSIKPHLIIIIILICCVVVWHGLRTNPFQANWIETEVLILFALMSDVAQCHVAHKLHSHIKWIRRSTAACNANKLYLSWCMCVTFHDNNNSDNHMWCFTYLCLPLPMPIPLFCIICTFVVHPTNERA